MILPPQVSDSFYIFAASAINIENYEYMNKVLLVYWPLQGNVEIAAEKIASALNDYSITRKSIGDVTPEDLIENDNWIIGGSTVGSHVWMDADDTNKWFAFFNMLDDMDLKTKTIAFYGLGDQILYPHHFVDGLGVFLEEFEKRDASIVGQWPVEGYNFYDSEGVKDGFFHGLALDEDQQPELTEERISNWIKQIESSFR